MTDRNLTSSVAAPVPEIEKSNVLAQDLDPAQVLGETEHRVAAGVGPHEGVADQIPRQEVLLEDRPDSAPQVVDGP